MPKFDALEDFLDEDLTLPAKGADGKVRDYTIPPPTAGELLRLKMMRQVTDDSNSNRQSADGDLAEIAAMSQREIIDDALSKPVVDAMIADGVPGDVFDRAITTGLLFRSGDLELARRVWSGKAQTPKTRSAKAGGGAGATRKASTSGTSTRKKSPKR